MTEQERQARRVHAGSADVCPADRAARAVNSNLPHTINQAVERSAQVGSPLSREGAADALRELSRQITQSGLPVGTILDPNHADRVLVPFHNGLYAASQVASNGTAKLKTVVIAR